MHYSDEFLREVLSSAKTIALVGASTNPARPSRMVGEFLVQKGYRVIGVNPGLAGKQMFGETVYADLASIPDQVDLVDIFRASDAVPGIVHDALTHLSGLQTIWMQLGVEHAQATQQAQAQGIKVVQDRCPKIEIARLGL
ncbi:CoA-binding protein [Loktanella sp. S4079]|uniref:CoA-binding protein n=1 Tax=Loktanella sp. S4079 TaxID=579483 RepID=UPI0005F9B354|nr:CoA-binding protein [Loktanella sp. S4079]